MRAVLLSLSMLLTWACAETASSGPGAPVKPQAASATHRGAEPAAASDLTFIGMCDASGAVALDARTFIVADDEDNVLRAYDVQRPGPPLWSVDMSSAIGAVPPKPNKAPPETDIEAGTRVGALAFWLTSHGRNASGKPKPERLKLFATTLPKAGVAATVAGVPYEHLLDDLLAEPRLARFSLEQAAALAPKARGGLNLEGMTLRREGGVWIGFRNPIPDGAALLVPLLNPEQVIYGKRTELGEPRLLDLGGYGVRAISEHAGRYLILAGPYDASRGARLYAWDGEAKVTLRAEQELAGLNPEGFFTPDDGGVLVLSDDGSVSIDGVECKRLKDASKKRYRARWVTP
jgi:hypothetical protein